MENNITFQKGKKKRGELQLLVLHFIVSDDWINKIGYDAFCAWLKFYSWCDRSKDRVDRENDVIPTSFTNLMKKLAIRRKKFYNSIIRSLWNYGLIDIIQFDNSVNAGQKPMNIIVYEYPQKGGKKKNERFKIIIEKIRIKTSKRIRVKQRVDVLQNY